jgi:predicted O-methyltransferase YrrM
MVPESLRRALRSVQLLLSRFRMATSYFNQKYAQILKWLFSSQETSNFTYELTDENLMVLTHVCSLVTKRPYAEIQAYIEEARGNSELISHISECEKRNSMQSMVGEVNDFGRRLGWYAIARAIKPKLIVETGVERGHGALLLSYALMKNTAEGAPGQYLGTDINPGAGVLLSGKYATHGKILYGDSIESLLKIQEPIDLFINDSDHSADYEAQEYETIAKKLSKNAIVLGDNSHVTEKLALFSKTANRSFLFFKEVPKDHWYPGAGIGISFNPN